MNDLTPLICPIVNITPNHGFDYWLDTVIKDQAEYYDLSEKDHKDLQDDLAKIQEEIESNS